MSMFDINTKLFFFKYLYQTYFYNYKKQTISYLFTTRKKYYRKNILILEDLYEE